MNKWKSIWSAIRDPRKIGDLLECDLERAEYVRTLFCRIKEAGLVSDAFSGNPARDIGSALELAWRWNLTLTEGTCFSDCRAGLHEDHWLSPLNTNVPSWNYGTFTLKNPADVGEIYAYGLDVQQAVCLCLLNAREAGVI